MGMVKRGTTTVLTMEHSCTCVMLGVGIQFYLIESCMMMSELITQPFSLNEMSGFGFCLTFKMSRLSKCNMRTISSYFDFNLSPQKIKLPMSTFNKIYNSDENVLVHLGTFFAISTHCSLHFQSRPGLQYST